jgi:pyruvate dehydrogenase E2 component (dihydrolipoamide acetyltransferase)
MPVDILVPPLSQTMDTLVIVDWLKQVGDPVVKGETLFRVETDKATLEVESPATGILRSISAVAGEEVKIKSIIGSIGEPGEESGGAPSPKRVNRIFASPRARQLAQSRGIPLDELQGSGTGPQQLIVERDVHAYLERQKAGNKVTPLARRIAEGTGVDLSRVVPAKPGAAITKVDVEATLNAASRVPISTTPAAQGSSQVVPLSPTRKTIARRMLESHLMTAPVSYLREVDATRLVRLRDHILQKLSGEDLHPTYTDFLVFITCRALAKHPALNATFDGETLEVFSAIHMALAVDTERGLMAPVMRDAGKMGVGEIARKRNELMDRVIRGTVSPEDLSGGTFTLTNLGTMGIDHFTPVINPPQVAVLGVGRIREVPAVHKAKIRIRHVMGLSLTCDHRCIDGAPAARFLIDVCNLIETPDLVWL